MTTATTSEYQELSVAQYIKNYAFGGISALIAIPILAAYGMANLSYMPYLLPINVGIVLASICAMLFNEKPDTIATYIGIALMTAVIIFCPLTIQNIIHTEKANITESNDYYINSQTIHVTPNHIIKNYWSSDALYARIINTIYDQRTLSVTISNEHNKSTNVNVNINNYLDVDQMEKIIQKTYND